MIFRVFEPGQDWDLEMDYGDILNTHELCLAAMTSSVGNMHR
jgi:hypothetical protein